MREKRIHIDLVEDTTQRHEIIAEFTVLAEQCSSSSLKSEIARYSYSNICFFSDVNSVFVVKEIPWNNFIVAVESLL